jgi:platelet-activating factor acetylhydrolase
MAAYLKSLNPVPSFPEHTGPYKVGTTDIELPVAALEAPSPPPDETIDTVQFRVFYPCESESKHHKRISWLPSPQRAHVSAYTKFLGAGSTLAEVISYVQSQPCAVDLLNTDTS